VKGNGADARYVRVHLCVRVRVRTMNWEMINLNSRDDVITVNITVNTVRSWGMVTDK
jgi:hypothetical protein